MGSIRVLPPVGSGVDVNITRVNGSKALVAYTDASYSSTTSLPAYISSAVTYFLPDEDVYQVTLSIGGLDAGSRTVPLGRDQSVAIAADVDSLVEVLAAASDLGASQFGALGSAKCSTDGAIISGSAQLTSPGIGFSGDDVGKIVTVTGAGAAGDMLVTTIAQVSGGVAQLSTTASTTVSDVAVTVGQDASVALQAAINAAQSTQQDLVIPDGRYLCTSGLTWDATTCSIRGSGNATLDFTAMASGFALTVVGRGSKLADGDVGYGFVQNLHEFAGIRLTGPDVDSTAVDGIKFTDTANGSHVNVNRCIVYGFRDGLYYDVSTWCIAVNESMIHHQHRYGANVNATTSAGENYSFVGTTFSAIRNGGGTAVAFYTSPDANADCYFYGCSFDYNDTEFSHNSGIITISGCHIENNSPRPMVLLSFTGGKEQVSFNMFGGSISPTEVSARSELIECVSGDNIWCDLYGVKFSTYGKNLNVYKITAGNPRVRLRAGNLNGGGGGQALPGPMLNQLYNGDWEVGADTGWSKGGTVTWSVQSTTKNSGTYALKAAGTGVVGSTFMVQNVPCRPHEDLHYRVAVAVDSMTGGSVAITIRWSAQDGTTQVSSSTIVTVSANQSFTEYRGKYRVPQGVHIAQFGIRPTDLNGNVYVDDCYVAVI